MADAAIGRAVQKVLAQMKEKYRVVIGLRDIDGCSYDEIAEALGCPVGTVESRLHRARKDLARRLKRVAREMGKEMS